MHRVVETHRPAKHIELVRGASANRIGTVVDEQLDDSEIATLGGEMNGVCVVTFVADVRIGAAIEQRSHDGLVPRAEVQRRAQTRIAWQRAALVDDVGMLVEDRGNCSGVAFAGSREQRRERCLRSTTGDEGVSEGDPALVPAFARKGMLHITQCGLFACVRIRAIQTCACLWIALAQRLSANAWQPCGDCRRWSRTPPSDQCLTSAYFRPEEGSNCRIEPGWVGGDSLAADRRRPSARWDQCAQKQAALSNSAMAGRSLIGRTTLYRTELGPIVCS